MILHEQIRAIISSLPSDASAITLTRLDLEKMAGDDDGTVVVGPMRDLTVEEVAEETGRAPSTVRGWLLSKELCGYKLNDRDWRSTRSALRQYLADQANGSLQTSDGAITEWRKHQWA